MFSCYHVTGTMPGTLNSFSLIIPTLQVKITRWSHTANKYQNSDLSYFYAFISCLSLQTILWNLILCINFCNYHQQSKYATGLSPKNNSLILSFYSHTLSFPSTLGNHFSVLHLYNFLISRMLGMESYSSRSFEIGFIHSSWCP